MAPKRGREASGDRELFFFSSRRRHTRFDYDWSSDVCSSDLSSHARLRPYTQIRPRSVSVLPIAIGCQAKCPFCFSHSSVSIDQPKQRSLSTARLHEVLDRKSVV